MGNIEDGEESGDSDFLAELEDEYVENRKRERKMEVGNKHTQMSKAHLTNKSIQKSSVARLS